MRLDPAGIALPARAARQLPVDPAAFVSIRHDHMQPPRRADGVVQMDVGAPARHVGGDRDATGPAGLRHDRGLLGVLPGRKHGVIQPRLRQRGRDGVGRGDRAGADQHRAASLLRGACAADDGPPLVRLGPVHAVTRGAAARRTVGGDRHDAQPVGGPQFAAHVPRGARHPAQVDVAAKERLIADLGPRHLRIGQAHAFLGLDQLVQPLLPRPIRHQPPREFVHDVHLVVLHDVVMVPVKHEQRGQCLAHQFLAPEPPAPDPARGMAEPLEPAATGIGQLDRPLLFAVQVVAAGLQRPGKVQRLAVGRLARLVASGFLGDDERRARLVDQHAVGLVHDPETEPAQHEPPRRRTALAGQPVAEVVEHDLLVRAVGDRMAVGCALRVLLHPGIHMRHAQPQKAVERCHLLGIAGHEIVVHGDHVDWHPRKRGGAGRQRRGQRFPLARRHLGDAAVEHGKPAHQLNREVALAQRAARDLAHQREGGLDRVATEPVAMQVRRKPSGPVPKRRIVERLERGGKAQDAPGPAAVGAGAAADVLAQRADRILCKAVQRGHRLPLAFGIAAADRSRPRLEGGGDAHSENLSRKSCRIAW